MAVLDSITIEKINNISPGADQVGLGDLMEQALSGVLPPGSISVGEVAVTTGSLMIGAASVGAELDASTDTAILIGNGTTATMNVLSGDVTMTNGGVVSLAQLTSKVLLPLNGGAASASGLLMGVGTTANPATTAVADSIFAEFRTQSTATSDRKSVV